ncbi:MAG TPA: transposase [Terriglobales bacterium]|nr:transposase [Terriglobales bacterium]
MAHTFRNLLYHAMFSTNNRCPTIAPDIRAYMGGIIRHMGGKALKVGGTADHVHLLLQLPSQIAIADTCACLRQTRPGELTNAGRNATCLAGTPATPLSR